MVSLEKVFSKFSSSSSSKENYPSLHFFINSLISKEDISIFFWK